MIEGAVIVILLGLVILLPLLFTLRGRSHLRLWVPAYVAQTPRRWRRRCVPGRQTRHLLFCFCDHFEPHWKAPDIVLERRRVDTWLVNYPAFAGEFTDADGRPPQHTFFFPAEEYAAEHLQKLARLCAGGWGEVEVHYHHDNDSEANMRAVLEDFKRKLRLHGFLGADLGTGALRFGFIHGNWALDNSRPDGRWCGINNELVILRDLGCYADFTLPSAPSTTQTRKINSIYWATDDPDRPKSHDGGVDIAVGSAPRGDLLLVQGPLALDWTQRKRGLWPAVENGEVSGSRPPRLHRVDLWVRQAIGVVGRPEWVFVKVYTHGCEERNAEALLGPPGRELHATLQRRYNDGERWRLHYVTARECYNIIVAAAAGKTGDPDAFRDFAVAPPPVRAAGGHRATTEARS